MPTQSPNTSLLAAKNSSQDDLSVAPLANDSAGVTFLLKNLAPPSILYVERNDILVVEALSQDTAETVNVFIRLLRADGTLVEIQDNVITASGLTATNFKRITLAEGYLLSLAFVCTNATQRGQCFVKAFINRGNFNVFAPNAARDLVSNYVTKAAPIGWPEGVLQYSTDGPGRLYRVQPGAPAAGADWTQVVPLNVRWRVKSIFVQLVTNANVANRQVVIQFRTSGTQVYWEGSANINIPATTTADVTCSPNLPYNSLITTIIQIPLPENAVIGNNDNIHSNTINLQAGDQWGNPFIEVEEWIDAGGV